MVPDGLSYFVAPDQINIRFKFLRVIGFSATFDRLHRLRVLTVVRRAKVRPDWCDSPAKVWGWEPFFQIHLDRGQQCVAK